MARKRHIYDTPAGKYSDDALEAAARYFASAGEIYPWHNRPAGFEWLPWAYGAQLQGFWLACRDRVAERVPSRAYELMEQHFASEDAGNFHNAWAPSEELDELRELLRQP